LFYLEVFDVINSWDDVIIPNLLFKKLGSDEQSRPNIFVLQALLKKLNRQVALLPM